MRVRLCLRESTLFRQSSTARAKLWGYLHIGAMVGLLTIVNSSPAFDIDVRISTRRQHMVSSRSALQTRQMRSLKILDLREVKAKVTDDD